MFFCKKENSFGIVHSTEEAGKQFERNVNFFNKIKNQKVSLLFRKATDRRLQRAFTFFSEIKEPIF